VGVEWPKKEDNTRVLLRALMMRVAYGHALACHYADDRAYHYQAWLWIDTHLDLLVAVAEKGGTPTDEALYPRLDACYPLPHRVLCAEELPDLGRYLVHVDFIMDSGKGKTQHPTLANELIHLLCKLMNQICHIRHLGDTILEYAALFKSPCRCPCVRYMQHHREIEQLVRLALKCSLLGNFPRCLVRLRLAARVRLAMQLTMEEPEPKALAAWIERHPFTVMFALRELFLYAFPNCIHCQ